MRRRVGLVKRRKKRRRYNLKKRMPTIYIIYNTGYERNAVIVSSLFHLIIL